MFSTKETELHFKHNFQSVRVLNELEEGYKDFKGLNLTYPVLGGILKHTSLKFKRGKLQGKSVVYENICGIEELHIEQSFSCSLEGQKVALADEIAQVCHDIEDAIEGNYESKEIICTQLQKLIEENDIYNLEKGTCINELITQRQVKYLISCIIGRVISDAVTEIKRI